ncbi:endonuclease/exonuclease/phosphatase family protein [Myxococcus sp. K15C18031901]|uniref:endonuclease/exonuclease/phosphatase family protein n=1 Tax=Myxococcus dinghuensis TaxID=2906761 RepID=UPI0020A7C9E4|nr:endonuclease/exonuclease/phosphatase family protein [Myxococcus dinghuensis]MCP3098464.1 endonuclease/exonuclease/phosphatase family protein [Myxococcus dinghuensis]
MEKDPTNSRWKCNRGDSDVTERVHARRDATLPAGMWLPFVRDSLRPTRVGASRPTFLRTGLWLGLVLGLVGCDGRPPPDDAPGTTPDPIDKGAVRIAAFNVHRLFDTVCDSGSCGGSNYEALPSPTAFENQVSKLSTAIASLDADVVLLAEVETQVGLDALLARLPRLPHGVLGETGEPASVDVAVLSAHPITAVYGHRERPLVRPDGSSTRFSRELLEVHLDVDGAEVIVFAAHFRSKVNDDPGRRLAEAEATRDIVSQVAARSPQALVVMGGDLNDVPGSEPLQALEKGGDLLRVASDRPTDQTWTYVYSGQRQAIDHLFFARGGGGGYVAGSFRAVREGNSGFGGSDHAAVHADFLPVR